MKEKKGGGLFGGLPNDSKLDHARAKNDHDADDDSGGGGLGKRMRGTYKKEKLHKLIGEGKIYADKFHSFLTRDLTQVEDLKRSPVSDDKKNIQKEQDADKKTDAIHEEVKEEKKSSDEKDFDEKDNVVENAETIEDNRRAVTGNKKAGSNVSSVINAHGFIRQVDISGSSIEKGAGAIAEAGSIKYSNAVSGEGADSAYHGTGNQANHQGVATRQVQGGQTGSVLFNNAQKKNPTQKTQTVEPNSTPTSSNPNKPVSGRGR